MVALAVGANRIRLELEPTDQAGIFVALGAGSTDVAGVSRAVVFLMLSFMTRQQMYIWKENESLFTHVSQIKNESAFGHRHLAFHSLDIAKNRSLAEWHFQQALAANPNSAETGFNYGVFLTEEGRFEEAISVYRRAIELSPHDIQTRTNLIILLNKNGMQEDAERYSREGDRFNK